MIPSLQGALHLQIQVVLSRDFQSAVCVLQAVEVDCGTALGLRGRANIDSVVSTFSQDFVDVSAGQAPILIHRIGDSVVPMLLDSGALIAEDVVVLGRFP